MSFSDRLKAIIDYKSKNQTEFAKKININRTTITSILRTDSSPNLELIDAITSNFPDINLHWLVTGQGSMHGSPKNTLTIQHTENNGYINQSVGLADCEKQVVALQAELLAAQKKIIALLEKGT